MLNLVDRGLFIPTDFKLHMTFSASWNFDIWFDGFFGQTESTLPAVARVVNRDTCFVYGLLEGIALVAVNSVPVTIFVLTIHPYNVLPQVVVNLKTVKSFQKQLHAVMKKCANEGIPNWEIFLHRGIHLRGVTFFRKLFCN